MQIDKVIDDTFHLLNRIRSNPVEFAQAYSQLSKNYNGKVYRDSIKTRQGVKALDSLINDLQSRKACSKNLKWSFALHLAADEQAVKLGQNGLLTTEDTRFQMILPDRCKQYSIVRGRISEVYEFGCETAQEIIEWLLLDDGLESRKRRATLLDPIYNYIGIGSSLHSKEGYVTVIILAEDIISLVAPGQQGYYRKRQTIEQGKNLIFKIFQDKKNQGKKIQYVPMADSMNQSLNISQQQRNRFQNQNINTQPASNSFWNALLRPS